MLFPNHKIKSNIASRAFKGAESTPGRATAVDGALERLVLQTRIRSPSRDVITTNIIFRDVPILGYARVEAQVSKHTLDP